MNLILRKTFLNPIFIPKNYYMIVYYLFFNCNRNTFDKNRFNE